MRRINIASPDFECDAEDPEGFRSGMARLGKLLDGAEESGITVYELPPGQAICPHHYKGAHGVRNETEEPARVLAFLTAITNPNSDTVGIWTGNSEANVMVRRESKVDYFDGDA